jgi:hypothetical protein
VASVSVAVRPRKIDAIQFANDVLEHFGVLMRPSGDMAIDDARGDRSDPETDLPFGGEQPEIRIPSAKALHDLGRLKRFWYLAVLACRLLGCAVELAIIEPPAQRFG